MTYTAGDDFADTTATTGSVAVGGQTTGSIELANDVDWFKVTLEAGKTYVFDLLGADGGGGTLGAGDTGEAYLTLYGTNGYFLDSAYNNGTGGDPRLSFTPTVNGTYYLGVSDLYGQPGTYTVQVAESNIYANYAPSGAVSITGTAQQGQILTASNTLADADGLGAISYQWKAGGVAITGATASSYTLTQAEVGKTISVVASYTDGFGTQESKASAATIAVVNVNDLPTGGVTISGSATQGQTLTAANTLADVDGLGAISYQWKAGGVVITGATASSYTLTQAEVGKTISVVASYTDALGTKEGKTSVATPVVLNGLVSGTAGNDVLMGTHGADTLTGLAGNDTYQVRQAGDVVTEASGAGTDTVYSYLTHTTGQTYLLTANVENGRILATGASNLSGNSLSNTLYAGLGNNVLNGGTGTDTVSYQYGLVSGATLGVNVSLGIATAQVTGRSGSDTLTSVENLTGSSLNDTLTGSAGNNVLNGSAGNDSLLGGEGNDTLIGGAGKDTLVSGNGNDTFDFNALSETGTTSATWDVISSFVRGQDKIDLSTLDANTATAANDAFNGTLIGSAVSFTVAGQLKLISGVLYGNTDTDATAEFAIQLTGVTALSVTDLIV